MTLQFCPRCGTHRPGGARYCPTCRVDLVELEAEAEGDEAGVEAPAQHTRVVEGPRGPSDALPASPWHEPAPQPAATSNPLRRAAELPLGLLAAHTDGVAIALGVVAVGGVAWALLAVARLPALAVVLLAPTLAGLAIALFRVEPAVPLVARLDREVEQRRDVPRSGLIGRFGIRPFLALLGLIGTMSASFGAGGAVAAGLRLAGYSLATVGIGAAVAYAVIFIVGLLIAVVVLAVALWLVLAFLGIGVRRSPQSGPIGGRGLESLLPPMISGGSGTIPTGPGFPTFGQPRDAAPLVDQVVAVIDGDGYIREPGLAGAPLGRLRPDGRVEGPGIFGPATHVVGEDGRIYAVDGILREPTGYRLAPDGRILKSGIVDVETGLRIENRE